MGSYEDDAVVVLREVVNRYRRNGSQVERLPGIAAIGAMENADVGARINALAAWRVVGAAGAAVVCAVDQDFQDGHVRQRRGAGKLSVVLGSVGLGPGFPEVRRFVN